MSQAMGALPGAAPAGTETSFRVDGMAFGCCALGCAVLAVVLAGWMPLGFSIVTVFLFAGPHNWFEFRYFLSRMPARWGSRQAFYQLGVLGAVLLAGLFALATVIGRWQDWSEGGWQLFSSLWNSLLIGWLATLIWLRGRETKSADLTWVWGAACGLLAVAWAFPAQWDVALVYLHPLVALCFLQREVRRHRPRWLPAYYTVLGTLPVLLGVLWWQLAGTPDLPGADALTMRITQHAGADVMSGVSSRLLVATHTFLEMLHYSVWLMAIPLLTYRTAPWRLQGAPLAKRTSPWRTIVQAVAVAGGAAVLLLWGCFLADYPTTRDVYFTVAMLHVLAEFPFLIGTV